MLHAVRIAEREVAGRELRTIGSAGGHGLFGLRARDVRLHPASSGAELMPELRFDRAGVLAMANKGRNTNGSQFFITEKATPWLDGHHTIFGQCTGAEVIKRIARVPTTPQDRPLDAVVIEKVTILRAPTR